MGGGWLQEVGLRAIGASRGRGGTGGHDAVLFFGRRGLQDAGALNGGASGRGGFGRRVLRAVVGRLQAVGALGGLRTTRLQTGSAPRTTTSLKFVVEALMAEVVRASQDWGFFVVVQHGVPAEVVSRAVEA
ncbi:hypothetical protein GUJ93_ZPchr0014g47559 [Zizania palustris]|uniref:Non-haem dioxygenase N-terminal domain-containing protein n=1 Tax=Zizania palustris TaxID=103762 RepID=A0A8J5SVY6_ZIZPA|nr:hypothetical protein GUJ93_ZPchr0014g47559 [Zizania palustris]